MKMCCLSRFLNWLVMNSRYRYVLVIFICFVTSCANKEKLYERKFFSLLEVLSIDVTKQGRWVVTIIPLENNCSPCSENVFNEIDFLIERNADIILSGNSKKVIRNFLSFEAKDMEYFVIDDQAHSYKYGVSNRYPVFVLLEQGSIVETIETNTIKLHNDLDDVKAFLNLESF